MRRSSLSNQLRAERATDLREANPEELVARALELFREAVDGLVARGIPRAEAIRRIRASRQAGRRPSCAAEP